MADSPGPSSRTQSGASRSLRKSLRARTASPSAFPRSPARASRASVPNQPLHATAGSLFSLCSLRSLRSFLFAPCVSYLFANAMSYPELPDRFREFLMHKPETGMGYQTGRVVLRDGRRFEDVLFVQGSWITEVRGHDSIPFDPADIEGIEITHSKWKWKTT